MGFRWSLYIVGKDDKLAFAMHENSIMRILGYVMSYFADGGHPVKPSNLYINFNHEHQKLKLGSEHFTSDGRDVTPALIQWIEAVDPGWRVKGGGPVFEEAATKKQIKISEHKLGQFDLQARLDNMGKPREITFYSVMDVVFGKR